MLLLCNTIVDGVWSDWSPYADCSVTCGAGSQTRIRECDSPEPSNGGSNCVGDSSETTACEESACLGTLFHYIYMTKTNSSKIFLKWHQLRLCLYLFSFSGWWMVSLECIWYMQLNLWHWIKIKNKNLHKSIPK